MNEAALCPPGALAVSSWRSGRPAAIQYNASVVQSHSVRSEVMRVLGLGVDEECAHIFQRMLEECVIQVEPCTGVASVVKRLMQKRHDFDIVLINGNHPGSSEAKVLRDVCTNMDIPVIIMSGEDMVAMIIRGSVHRVLEPYIKEVLWGLWQDVVRKRISASSVGLDQTENLENRIEQQQKPWEGFDDKASIGEVNLKSLSNSKRKSTDQNTRKPNAISPVKKQRAAWTPGLHILFLQAIAALGGLDKAVPSKIKEVMNVPGLTREHIASHLQKYRQGFKKGKKGRHGTAVGCKSQPGQPEPKVISQESQQKMNTATLNQPQQMIDQNEWQLQQSLPSFPDPNANDQMPPPLQSTEPAVTGKTGQLFLSDNALSEMHFPGGNGPTEARIEESHNPIPHIPSQSDLLVSSQAEFRTEEPGSTDDFWNFQDWELPNLGMQFRGFQLEDVFHYPPDENTGPSTGAISDVQVSAPFVDIPAGLETTLPGTNPQSMPDDYFKMLQDLDMFFPEDQGQGGGTEIHDDGMALTSSRS